MFEASRGAWCVPPPEIGRPWGCALCVVQACAGRSLFLLSRVGACPHVASFSVWALASSRILMLSRSRAYVVTLPLVRAWPGVRCRSPSCDGLAGRALSLYLLLQLGHGCVVTLPLVAPRTGVGLRISYSCSSDSRASSCVPPSGAGTSLQLPSTHRATMLHEGCVESTVAHTAPLHRLRRAASNSAWTAAATTARVPPAAHPQQSPWTATHSESFVHWVRRVGLTVPVAETSSPRPEEGAVNSRRPLTFSGPVAPPWTKEADCGCFPASMPPSWCRRVPSVVRQEHAPRRKRARPRTATPRPRWPNAKDP